MTAFRIVCIASLIALGSVAAACGSTSDTNPAGPAAPDAGDEASVQTDEGGANGDAGYPAFPPPDPPQVQDYGGPVLKAPKITPVFFATDDPATTAKVQDFVSKVGATNYWSAINTEYGVGPATMGTPIQLTDVDNQPSTIDDTDIQAWLAAKLNSDDPAFGKADGNSLYALFYPTGITITLGGTPQTGNDGGLDEAGVDAGSDGGTDGGGGFGRGPQKSCNSFGGYHGNIKLDAAHANTLVAYAVIPRCATFGDLSGLDAITGTASHEFVEAATDPYPDQNTGIPAYAAIDDQHFYWETFLGGGEIGDMCAQDPRSFTKFMELPYTVQRSWSNKAAKTGHDPCQPPMPSSVYFNTAPSFKDTIPISVGGQTVNVRGIKIAVGQSGVVPLEAWSDGPTSGPWTISVDDLAGLSGQTPQLKFMLDKPSAQNGDTINLTINVVSAGKRNRETFVVTSKLGANTNTWIGVVGN
jgi:hypothetical protein